MPESRGDRVLQGELLKRTTEHDLWLIGQRLVLTLPGVRPTSTSWEAFWHYETVDQALNAAKAWDMTKDRNPGHDGIRITADARPPWDPAEALARLEQLADPQ